MPEKSITTPYSSVQPLLKGEANWIPELERERIESYTTYDDIYWNVPDTFKFITRGTDQPPIYIPNARTICDVTAHYVLKGLSVGVEEPEKNPDLSAALLAFLRRERFFSKFATAKHSGVVKGDYIFHLTADGLLPATRKISLTSLDPAVYFPIYDDDDLDKRIKVHLVDQVLGDDPKAEPRVKKLTYEQVIVDGRLRVSRFEAIYPLDDWDGPDAEAEEVLLPEELLPEEIDVIPVYHLQNIAWQSRPYGTSEIAGFERLLAGVNQAVTDEDVALALEGLGVYATDSGPPTDDDGNVRDWEISPGHVIELSGTYFKRVEGLSSVEPLLSHIKYLEESLWRGTGLSDVSRGQVETSVAESGIALAIKFLPTLAKIEQRDQLGMEKLMNLFFDWKKWHKAYEGQDFITKDDILAKIGEKLPFNRTAILNELNNMLDRSVISRAFYRQEMTKLGYKFPEDMDKVILEENKALAETADPFSARIVNESDGTEATQPVEEQTA